jgi:hypothetical protein
MLSGDSSKQKHVVHARLRLSRQPALAGTRLADLSPASAIQSTTMTTTFLSANCVTVPTAIKPHSALIYYKGFVSSTARPFDV